MVAREVGAPDSRIAGRDAAEILGDLEPRTGPERILDLLVRTGPYGDAFGDDPDGLTLDRLEASPHGVDLGALEPRLPGRAAHGLGQGRARARGDRRRRSAARRRRSTRGNGHVVLIGRRQLRSNNSWMHNLEPLVKGKDSCTLHVHPDDADRIGLVDGAGARLRSAAGELEAPVEVTDAIMPGVVSIPHGWGHDTDGARMRVAAAHAGVNSNLLADESQIDAVSGNAVLNGIPVEVEPVGAPEPVTSAAPAV